MIKEGMPESESPVPAPEEPSAAATDTAAQWYTERMTRIGVRSGLVREVHSLAYRRHIRSLTGDRVLDVGCGIGSNLRYVGAGSVGVDHNAHSVAETVARGFTAYVPEDFHARADEFKGAFDTMLVAHVMEHLDREAGVALLAEYLPYLKPAGWITLIMPQEAGYRTDPTHVRLVGFEAAADLLSAVGFQVSRQFSWPLPRKYGPKLSSNEFVLVGKSST